MIEVTTNLNELIKKLGIAKKQAKQLKKTLEEINKFELRTTSKATRR